MKVIRSLVLATMATLSFQVGASVVEQIDLIRSADLFRITNLSMHYESLQYSNYSRWKVVADELATKQLVRDQAEAEFNRVRELFEKGIAKEIDFKRAKLDFDVAESELNLQRARVLSIASDVKRYQLLMLAEGNPEDDYRRPMAMNLKSRYEAQLAILSAELQGASGTLGFYEHQLDVTRQLFEKGFRTKSQVERWEFLVQNQKNIISSIGHRQESARQGIAGADLVLERI